MSFSKTRFDAYERLLRLHQPSGALLLLWPTLSALWLATGGRPPLSLIIIFVMGTLLMRSAACAISGWLDRDRSHEGGAAQGAAQGASQSAMASWEALALAGVLTLIALCFVWFTTRLAIGISAIALAVAVVLALLHSLFKRAFSLPHAALGLLFLFGVPATFAAANNTVPWYAWGLMGVHLFWIVVCDIGVAMANREEDRALGRRSLSLLAGRFDAAAMAVCYAMFLAGMAYVGHWWRLGVAYWIALALAAAGMVFFLRFIRNRETSRCVIAFRNQHWIVMAIFIGIVVDYALRLHAWPVLGR
ncbi:MAG: UbiA family prenyltransferase [Burkholderiales bacterium]|nr:UbiA family prenyltransferase [Burkholderiales bacterium]